MYLINLQNRELTVCDFVVWNMLQELPNIMRTAIVLLLLLTEHDLLLF